MERHEAVFNAPAAGGGLRRWSGIGLTLFCADAAFLSLYAWWLGAFLPTLTWVLATATLILLFLACLMLSAALLSGKDSKAGGGLFVLSIVVAAASVAAIPNLCLRAARRDVGETARQWAMGVLAKPRAEVLDTHAPEWFGPRLKGDLVPAYLKRGHFRGARLQPPNGSGGKPYVEVVYGGGRLGAQGYYLGSKTLDLTLGGNDGVRKIMPGVYSFTVPG